MAKERTPEYISYQKQYKILNKEKYASYYKNKLKAFRFKQYGLTIEDYDRMFEEQKGCCKICGKHQSECKRSLAVDHCHITNKVRGLLCNTCNHGLGYLKDDISILEKAINYLKQCH